MSCFDKYNLIFELFAGWFYSKLLKNAMCNDVKGNDVIALDIIFKYIKMCNIYHVFTSTKLCLPGKKTKKNNNFFEDMPNFLKICPI